MTHEFSWVPLTGGMLDQIKCSCGWESKTYFDGDVYAYYEWKKHVKETEDKQSHQPKDQSGL